MRVKKRDGSYEDVSFDKVTRRIKNHSEDLPNLNPTSIAQFVCARIYDGVPTSELDELTSQICSSYITEHPEYGILSSRIIISNHHKNTSPSFSEVINILYNAKDRLDNHNPLISNEVCSVVNEHKEKLNSIIDYDRDYDIDYFGFKTLERSYLLRVENKIIERPQHLFMRVALGIHGNDIKDAIETYDMLSKKLAIHATPTLFNAGTPKPQLSSCYLLALESDSISGIYSTLKDCAQISKWAGGIGLHIHNVRATGSHIRGTNGSSNGIVPMLRVFNNTARYVDQGGGRRNGSFAIYLEPWHADIDNFLELKKNHGDEEMKARDLFYALWIPDLFMERVKTNGDWTLMCPDECPGLSDSHSDEFVKLYTDYEKNNKGRKTIKARDLWFRIMDSQMETGTPYILYKDAANKKSNQQNLGTIKSSNLCTEIIEYSDDKETAVCNLASIGLSRFVKDDKSFDYDKLHEVTKVVTENLNRVIDINFYPTDKTIRSNFRHRPIGLGVQGLADVFALMNISFCSDEARATNKRIFETIYHAAVESSMELSKKRNNIITDILNNNSEEDITKYVNEFEEDIIKTKYIGAYSSFEGSPISRGLFQFDLWGEKPSERYDWDKLREDIKSFGIRNSLLISPMPTASTSQIMGFNESFEPFTNNIFQRKTLSGEFIVINKYLIRELMSKGMWNKELKDTIILHEGSIQNIKEISKEMKELYKTSWEIKQRVIIDMSADRGRYICQTQSLNIFMEEPDFQKLSSMHFYGHSKGLKTGSYYLRTKPRAKTQQFTIDPEFAKRKLKCAEDNEDSCVLCSA